MTDILEFPDAGEPNGVALIRASAIKAMRGYDDQTFVYLGDSALLIDTPLADAAREWRRAQTLHSTVQPDHSDVAASILDQLDDAWGNAQNNEAGTVKAIGALTRAVLLNGGMETT